MEINPGTFKDKAKLLTKTTGKLKEAKEIGTGGGGGKADRKMSAVGSFDCQPKSFVHNQTAERATFGFQKVGSRLSGWIGGEEGLICTKRKKVEKI
jgi:hypothetical protein